MKRTVLGGPLQMNNLGDREFAKLVEVPGVRRIKFHGLRHTSATLAMGEGPAEHIGAPEPDFDGRRLSIACTERRGEISLVVDDLKRRFRGSLVPS